jgi:hypothetical protein
MPTANSKIIILVTISWALVHNSPRIHNKISDLYKKWYTYSMQGCERYLKFLAKVLEKNLATFACWTIYKGHSMICD